MSLIRDLLKIDRPLAHSCRFTVWNGFVYLAAGALLIAWPGAVQALFFEPEFVGRE